MTDPLRPSKGRPALSRPVAADPDSKATPDPKNAAEASSAAVAYPPGLDGTSALDAPSVKRAALIGTEAAVPFVGADPISGATAASASVGAGPAAAAAAAKSLSAVFDALPTEGGGPAQARLLSKNLDAWNARWDMLTSATKTIDTTYFILEKDPYGFAFLGALLAKQLQGVQTRLMTDAMADTFGTHGFKMPLRGKDYLEELVNHGGEAFIYHPVSSRPLDLVTHGGYSALASNHDKILVVDGQRSITGGRNIAKDYFADVADHPGAWRDMDVALEGAGTAKGLTAAFDAELENGDAAKKVTKDVLGNWVKRDIELLGAYAMMDYWVKAPPFTEAQKQAFRADPESQKALVKELVDHALKTVPTLQPENLRRAPSEREIEFLTKNATELATQLEARGSNLAYHQSGEAERKTEAKIVDQTSAAAGKRINGMAPALKDMVAAATKKIVIENPYVVLTEDMLQALESASKRGVEITVITNSPLSTDSDVTQAFFLEDWQSILARCPTARIFVATGHQKFHTKSAVVDGEDAFVSTYNLDLLSGYVNSEVGAIVKSKELAGDLERLLNEDLRRESNGFLEYRIKKDADGNAVLKDGQPIPEFGPEDHLPRDILETYAKKRSLWGDKLRNLLPQFEPLRHPTKIGS